LTFIANRTEKCLVCGQVSKQKFVASTNTFGGSPDLDFRPPESERSTMPYWVQECPHCGYVANSLSQLIGFVCDRAYLSSSEYNDFQGTPPVAELAIRFVKKARIATLKKDYIAAFGAYLSAAWASDDEDDEKWQFELRNLALQAMEKIREDQFSDDYRIIRVDLLRKTRQYERLLQEYEHMRFEKNKKDLFNNILQFQVFLAKYQCSATYTVEEVETILSALKERGYI